MEPISIITEINRRAKMRRLIEEWRLLKTIKGRDGDTRENMDTGKSEKPRMAVMSRNERVFQTKVKRQLSQSVGIVVVSLSPRDHDWRQRLQAVAILWNETSHRARYRDAVMLFHDTLGLLAVFF